MQKQRKRALFFMILAISSIFALRVTFSSNYAVSAAISSSSANILQATVLWEKTYGGTGDDRAFSAITVENGYVIVGSSTSFLQGKTEAWVVRLDDQGEIVWNFTFPEGDFSEFRYVLGLADGFLFVGNMFSLSRDWDGYVVKTDNDGTCLWNFTLGGEKLDRFFSALQTPDGFILVGLTSSFGNGDSDVWVVKINEANTIVWSKTYGWSLYDCGRSITMTENDSFMIAGFTNSTGQGDYDFLMLNIDSSGSMLWNKTYGGIQSDKAYAIASTQGGYVIAGDTRSKGEGDSDSWVIKIDLDGNLLWDTAFGGKNFDQPTCIGVSAYDGILVGGFTFSFGNGERDFWLFKIDDSGNVLWSSTVGRNEFEEAYALLETAENEFVMVGWTNSIGIGIYDYYIVKISVTPSSGLPQYLPFVLLAVVAGVLCAVLLILFKRQKKKRVELISV